MVDAAVNNEYENNQFKVFDTFQALLKVDNEKNENHLDESM